MVLETEKLGPKVHGAMLIVKKFAIHKCSHDKTPVSGSQCLKSMVGKKNSSRYIIATQDRDLQTHLRTIPAVPILYLHQTTPCLEQPSEISLKTAKNKTDNLFGVNEYENNKIKALKEQSGIQESLDKPKKKKKKGGPNPLSCKRRKQKSETAGRVVKTEVEKPKRKKIRIPQHVKEELLKTAKKM